MKINPAPIFYLIADSVVSHKQLKKQTQKRIDKDVYRNLIEP